MLKEHSWQRRGWGDGGHCKGEGWNDLTVGGALTQVVPVSLENSKADGVIPTTKEVEAGE